MKKLWSLIVALLLIMGFTSIAHADDLSMDQNREQEIKLVDAQETTPMATKVTPTVYVTSIPNQTVGATVTVSARSTVPCYRMAASVYHNGKTDWLAGTYSSTYSQSFTVSSSGPYTVTVYSRSYPESDSRSGQGSKSVSFTVYNKVKPSISIRNISNATAFSSVSVYATASSPCFRMSANYVYNGETYWLGNLNSSTYTKTFTPTKAGNYTLNVFARSYPEDDPRSDASSKSISFTVSNPTKTLDVPLYRQSSSNTCGPTSACMMLSKLGVSCSESEFINYASAHYQDDYTYVYVIASTLNDKLQIAGKSTRYSYVSVGNMSSSDYTERIVENIVKGYPVQPVLKITDSSYFPYTSDGHYVVIKGVSGNKGIVNDPHNIYSNTYYVPFTSLLNYTKAHSSYIICVL